LQAPEAAVLSTLRQVHLQLANLAASVWHLHTACQVAQAMLSLSQVTLRHRTEHLVRCVWQQAHRPMDRQEQSQSALAQQAPKTALAASWCQVLALQQYLAARACP
jgi:hypothetical protein